MVNYLKARVVLVPIRGIIKACANWVLLLSSRKIDSGMIIPVQHNLILTTEGLGGIYHDSAGYANMSKRI
jgi:hypothetical protein